MIVPRAVPTSGVHSLRSNHLLDQDFDSVAVPLCFHAKQAAGLPLHMYWATIATLGGNIVTYVVLLIMQIWSCNPIRKSWDPFVVGGFCLDTKALNIGATAVNIASDTVIFILPQAVIWRLHMRTKQKVAVSLIFVNAVL